ncbi:hypothetical protein S40285_10493 [Stachybotrys chlorohalonatus IBT 40285]|uniref:Uncharacterized protein n=1 Tax=Stachybotrys chlorohalonatus (strain IBT 40285) TaxID=1283841 RepID=A0A084QT69_STAC4|nr:hypothetical protein S40285_10493 [Stachybotrys chlorohalonata IBT 40285]
MPTSKHPSQFDRQDRHGCPRRSLHQLISKFEVPNASWHASSATPTGMPDRNHPLPRLTTRPDRAEENGSQGLCPGSSTSPVSQIAQLDVLSPHGQASGLNCERAHTDPQLRTRTNEPSANDKISPIGLGDISNMNTTKLPVALRRGRFEKAVFLGSKPNSIPTASYETSAGIQEPNKASRCLIRPQHNTKVEKLEGLAGPMARPMPASEPQFNVSINGKSCAKCSGAPRCKPTRDRNVLGTLRYKDASTNVCERDFCDSLEKVVWSYPTALRQDVLELTSGSANAAGKRLTSDIEHPPGLPTESLEQASTTGIFRENTPSKATIPPDMLKAAAQALALQPSHSHSAEEDPAFGILNFQPSHHCTPINLDPKPTTRRRDTAPGPVRDVEKVLRRQRSKTFSQAGAAPEEVLQGRRASRPTTPSIFSIHTKTAASIAPSSAALKDRIGLFETLSSRNLTPEALLWQGTSVDEATEISDASIPNAESKRCGRLRGTLRRVSASLRPQRERKIVDTGAHFISPGQVRATDGALPINRTAPQTKNSLDSITWSIGLSEYVTSNESKKASVTSLPHSLTLHLLTEKGLPPGSGYLAEGGRLPASMLASESH